MLTKEQKQYILDNKGNKTQRAIARELGILEASVTYFLKNNGKISVSKSTLQQAKKYLIDNYESMTIEELASSLYRSTSWVSRICSELDIVPLTRREKLFYIFHHNKTKSIDELAKLTGLSRFSTIDYIHEFGIKHIELRKDKDHFKPKVSEEARIIINKWLDKLEAKLTGEEIVVNRPPAEYTNIPNTYFK